MRFFLITIALILYLPFASANAAVGEWFISDGAKFRLISLREGSTGKLSAALHIVLEPGWKTYWRSPGSSGIPPQLDFSQSKNVSFSGVRFPTPIAFKDGDALTSGYKGEVVLPLDIEILFPARDAELSVRGIIGVCAEVCIPLQFSVQLKDRAIGVSSFEAAQLLSAAMSSLPKQVKGKSMMLAVDAEPGFLRVEAEIPGDASDATLFLEGPQNWYLSPARATKVERGKAWFSVAIPEKINPADASGTALRATLVVGGRGFEQDLIVR